ncbi:MAG: tripartite tricarboxylate transporter TctB family protein [Actinomycetota bacterium]
MAHSTGSNGSGEGAVESSTPSAGGSGGRWSDRTLGIVSLVIAVWYVAATRTFNETAFATGPVGPETLPTIVGVLFGILALIIIIRPDEDPVWGSVGVWWRLGTVVAISFLYGQLLEPLGFVVASTILTVVIGVFFKAPILKLVSLAVVFSTAVAFVFNNWLGLHLPSGIWGGF